MDLKIDKKLGIGIKVLHYTFQTLKWNMENCVGSYKHIF